MKIKTHLNLINCLQQSPITDIIHNGEKLKAFSLGSGSRQECLLSPLLSTMEGSASTLRQGEEIKYT